MRIDEVKRQLEAFGVLDGYREFATSSATVELAAAAAGCEPGRIAKTYRQVQQLVLQYFLPI